jgi:hypothetical protein
MLTYAGGTLQAIVQEWTAVCKHEAKEAKEAKDATKETREVSGPGNESAARIARSALGFSAQDGPAIVVLAGSAALLDVC